MDKKINIIALDKNFVTLGLLNYSNLQWTRCFHEPGKFSLQVPLNQYNKDIHYIYTKDRREMGEVSQINFYIKNGVKSVNISGYFIENKLNNMICYQKGNYTNIIGAPTWNTASGKAESVAYAFYDAFKQIKYTQDGQTIESKLNINAAQDKGRGHDAEHQRGNQQLGHKIYTILKPSKMSYKVDYDFLTNAMSFEVWQGVDRTSLNPELNNPIVFSTRFGNVNNVDFLLSDTKYKQSYIVTAKVSKDNVDTIYTYAGNIRQADDVQDAFLYLQSNENGAEYSSADAFIKAINADGLEKVKQETKTISLDFDTIAGSYEYMQDFDLGDICTVEIPELDLSMSATITKCFEVFNKGVHKLTLELSI